MLNKKSGARKQPDSSAAKHWLHTYIQNAGQRFKLSLSCTSEFVITCYPCRLILIKFISF